LLQGCRRVAPGGVRPPPLPPRAQCGSGPGSRPSVGVGRSHEGLLGRRSRCVRACVRPSARWSVCLSSVFPLRSVGPPACLFFLSVILSVFQFVHASNRLFICLSVCLFVCLFIFLGLCLSFCAYAHTFVCASVCVTGSSWRFL